jgi:hypothetical protein
MFSTANAEAFFLGMKYHMQNLIKPFGIGLLFFLLLFDSVTAIAAEHSTGKGFNIEIEFGPVWQANNDVRIPGNRGTLFRFEDVTDSGPYAAGRLIIGWDIRKRHGLQFVAAPLRINGSGTFNEAVSFAGSSFAAGTSTEGSYKFDTYRLTYRYMFLDKNNWRLSAGATVLLRDAEIELQQNGVKASKSNVGIVPLLSLAAKWSLINRWTAIFDFEGLAGGPGRAFDVAIKLQYHLTDRVWIGAGYRILEGGADNDDVYNFAWFNYALISLGYRF